MLRSNRFRWRSLLVGALCLTLIPALVLGSASSADAVTKNGPSASFAWSFDAWMPGDNGSCTAAAHWNRVDNLPPTLVVAGLACSLGFNFDGSLEGNGGDLFEVDAACSGIEFQYTSTTFDLGNQGGGFTMTAIDTAANFDGCIVDNIWIHFKNDRWGNDSTYDVNTTMAGLGSPPASTPPPTVDPDGPVTACEYYDFASVRAWVDGPFSQTPLATGGGTLHVRVKGLVKQPTVSNNLSVRIYARRTYSGGTNNYLVNEQDLAVGAGGIWKYDAVQQSGNLALSSNAVYAVSVAASPYVAGGTGQTTLPHKKVWGLYGQPAHEGITDPPNCAWHVGEKVIDRPGDTLDQPYGPLLGAPAAVTPDDPEPTNTNPAPASADDGSCAGFSFTDPTSWAGAGICVLVKAMGGLIAAVKAVSSSILSGLGNVFSAAFVPSTSLADQNAQLHAQIGGSSLGAWQDSLSAITAAAPTAAGAAARSTGAASRGGAVPSSVPGDGGGGGATLPTLPHGNGCFGPGFTWDYFPKLGMPATMYPFNACDGTGATVAQLCRFLLTMFVGLSSFLKILQMIMVALGAARTISTLNLDWSDATYYGPNYPS